MRCGTLKCFPSAALNCIVIISYCWVPVSLAICICFVVVAVVIVCFFTPLRALAGLKVLCHASVLSCPGIVLQLVAFNFHYSHLTAQNYAVYLGGGREKRGRPTNKIQLLACNVGCLGNFCTHFPRALDSMLHCISQFIGRQRESMQHIDK